MPCSCLPVSFLWLQKRVHGVRHAPKQARANLFDRLRDSRLQADTTLSKANRASAFDAGKNLRAEIISHGMESSISSGNWSIKRFRMERKGVTQAHLILTTLSSWQWLFDRCFMQLSCISVTMAFTEEHHLGMPYPIRQSSDRSDSGKSSMAVCPCVLLHFYQHTACMLSHNDVVVIWL